jgi:hypothetical protein
MVVLPSKIVAQEPQAITATIFTDPQAVETTEVGVNYTVNINVSNVVDLYAWQAGITYNPGVLNFTGFYEGDFLKRTNQTTLFLHHIRNANYSGGIVYFRGGCLLGQLSGINGSGQLAYVTFVSVGIGVSDFHLTDILLLSTKLVGFPQQLADIPFEVVESVSVLLNETNYGIGIANNFTGISSPENPPASGVLNSSFSAQDKRITFEALTVKDWHIEVDIPKTLLRSETLDNWTVQANGSPISYIASENKTHTSLTFAHTSGTYTIEITGAQVGGNPATPPTNPVDQVNSVGLEPPVMVVVTASLLGLTALTAAFIDRMRTRKALGYARIHP